MVDVTVRLTIEEGERLNDLVQEAWRGVVVPGPAAGLEWRKEVGKMVRVRDKLAGSIRRAKAKTSE